MEDFWREVREDVVDFWKMIRHPRQYAEENRARIAQVGVLFEELRELASRAEGFSVFVGKRVTEVLLPGGETTVGFSERDGLAVYSHPPHGTLSICEPVRHALFNRVERLKSLLETREIELSDPES